MEPVASRICHLCGADDPFAIVAVVPEVMPRGTTPPGALTSRVTLCPHCFHRELSGGRLKPGEQLADPYVLVLSSVVTAE